MEGVGLGQCFQKGRDVLVGGELHAAVAQVHGLSGYVALP